MHEPENRTKIDVAGAYFYASLARKNSSITRVDFNFSASMNDVTVAPVSQSLNSSQRFRLSFLTWIKIKRLL